MLKIICASHLIETKNVHIQSLLPRRSLLHRPASASDRLDHLLAEVDVVHPAFVFQCLEQVGVVAEPGWSHARAARDAAASNLQQGFYCLGPISVNNLVGIGHLALPMIGSFSENILFILQQALQLDEKVDPAI